MTATLTTILAARSVRSIDDVVAIMTAIDQALPDSDGVKWFNRLYLRVTVSVNAAAATATAFQDAAFLRRLDVVFANLYFDAAAAGEVDPVNAPSAWRPLFQSRHDRGIARLQFALAGMNAHINRDLAAGIVHCYGEMGGAPAVTDVRHTDFEQINGLLERVEGEVKTEFTTGLVGEIDRLAGGLDDLAAIWKVRRARDIAWSNAELLWHLRPFPELKNKFFSQLDSFTGLAGRGLLKPVVIAPH
jgi:uncharacterized protein DUF5995